MTVQEEIRQAIGTDAVLVKLRRKIESGKADFNDTFRYSDRAAKLLGEIFARRLPDIPADEREAVCVAILYDRYTDINALCDRVQRMMDEAAGLDLNPQHAPFPKERAHTIGASTADQTKPLETQQRRAESAAATATRALHDDRMEAEADMRSRLGLQCYITRLTDGNCCPWCNDVAGRYKYGEEPENIYQRHDNCSCTVTYECGRMRQDVWSKRTWGVDPDKVQGFESDSFSQKDAKELEETALQGLTLPAERGTISVDEFIPAKTIEEANAFARDVLGIPNASYDGADILVANEWNKGIAYAFRRFPELRNDFGFTGTLLGRHALTFDLSMEYYEGLYRKQHPRWKESKVQRYAHNAAIYDYNRYAFNDFSMVYAASNHDKKPYLKGIHGISVNSDVVKDTNDFRVQLMKSVEDKHRPEGCFTIRSILDHEIGHRLDELVEASKDEKITGIIDSMTAEELTESLSSYSWKNDNKNKYEEAIAEAWSEYCNNPNCRPVAKAIGERIEELYRIKYRR